MLTQTTTKNKMQDESPNMLAWALAYARIGFHVFPCHVPLFDHPKGYKCSCEEWRHSDRCKATKPRLYLEPHQHCDRPGKHPRGVQHGKDDASNDVAQIRKWWSKYPNANIGCLPGRSGHAALDADVYKDVFGGTSLTREEEETPTVRTGGGGNHLWYRKHNGAVYSNATGTLPPGIDVRADGGYVILPPSLHASGFRYQWEDGYEPNKIEYQLLPDRIHDILVEATARSSGRRSTIGGRIRLAEPTTPMPDLGAWKIGRKTRDAIMAQPVQGTRSSVDMRVCIALAGAGMTDEDILAVFEHLPIGINGKFAEQGIDYLDRTIGAAREYVETHPRQEEVRKPDATFLEQVESLRLWARTTVFSDVEPSLLKVRVDKETGEVVGRTYNTDSIDTKVFDALCDLWAKAGRFATKPIGKKLLAKQAGCSPNSAAGALKRLATFAVVVEEDPDGWGSKVALNTGVVCPILTPLQNDTIVNTGGQDRSNDANKYRYIGVNEYSPRKAHDAYQSGTSRFVRKQMRSASEGDFWYRPTSSSPDKSEAVWSEFSGLSPEEWQEQRDVFMAKMFAIDHPEKKVKPRKTAEQREWDRERRGLGETSLRVLDALARCGEMTPKELAEETGKSIHAIRDALSRLNRLMPELVYGERDGARGPKVWMLEEGAFAEAESRVSGMKTYKMALGREEQRLEQAINWTIHMQGFPEEEGYAKAQERVVKLEQERAKVVQEMYDLDDDAAKLYASVTNHSEWEDNLDRIAEAKAKQYDVDFFMNVQLPKVAIEMKEQLAGLSRAEAASKLRFIEWSEMEINAILENVGDVLVDEASRNRMSDGEFIHRKMIAQGKALAEANWMELHKLASEKSELGTAWWVRKDIEGVVDMMSELGFALEAA